MTAYLPWLFLLVCPLMMMFMMRGMGGGSTKDPEQNKAMTPYPARPVGDQQARIAQLEREVAELRRVSLHKTGDNPASRR